jgi:hypothetical protein
MTPAVMISRSCTALSVTPARKPPQSLTYDAAMPRSATATPVPLEAGLGPENPPCPACGEPLFGWTTAPADHSPVRRCEACGLGVVGERETGQDEAQASVGRASGRSVPNRSSLQAWLGESGWAGLEPSSRFLLTPESARLLGAPAAQPRPAFLLMWQTILNSFTFGHNIALGAFGRAATVPAQRRWQRALDGAVSVLAAPIAAVVAAVLEGAAAIAGRGGALALR